jgi:hypothetical protein
MWYGRWHTDYWLRDRFEIKTGMSHEEVTRRLEEATERMPWRSSSTSTEKSFYGEIKEGGFIIRPAFGSPYVSGIIPVIRGIYRESAKGIIITVEMERPPQAYVLKYIIAGIWVVVIVLTFIVAAIYHWESYLLRVIFLLFWMILYFVINESIHMLYDRAKTRLCKVLGVKR